MPKHKADAVHTEKVCSDQNSEEIGADSHMKSPATNVKMEKWAEDNFVAVKVEPFNGETEYMGSFMSRCVDKFEMKTEQSEHDRNVESPQNSAQFVERLHPVAEADYDKIVSTASKVQPTKVKTEECLTDNCVAIKVEQCDTCSDYTGDIVAHSARELKVKTEEIDLGCDFIENSLELPNAKLSGNPGRLNDRLTHTGKIPLKCPVCEKKFAYNYYLSTHMLIHSGVKPYKCNVCEKTFTQKCHLNDHMLSHTTEKRHTCHECKKKFTFKRNLSAHMLTHSGVKAYKCDVCEKTFTQKRHLNDHMLLHTGEKPHTCQICKKKFTFKCNLSTHMLTHSGEKPHGCSVCDKQFRHLCSLNKHMLTHHGDGPHKCALCKMQFTQLSSLNNHMLTHR